MRTLRSKLRLHRVAFVVCAVFNFFSVGLENSWAQQSEVPVSELRQLPAAGQGSIPFVMVSIPCGTKFDDLIEPDNGRESNAPDYKQIVPKKNSPQLAAVLGLGAHQSIYPCPNPSDATPPDRKLVVPLDLLSDQARANYQVSSFQQPVLNVTGLLSDPSYGNNYVQFFQGLGIGTDRSKLSKSTILVTVGATVGTAAGLALASPLVVTLSTAAGTIYLAGTAGRWVTEAIKALIEVSNKTPHEAYDLGKELAAAGFARELKTTLLGVGTGVLTGIATTPLRNAAVSAAAAGPKVKTSPPKPAATDPTKTAPTPTTAGTQATELDQGLMAHAERELTRVTKDDVITDPTKAAAKAQLNKAARFVRDYFRYLQIKVRLKTPIGDDVEVAYPVNTVTFDQIIGVTGGYESRNFRLQFYTVVVREGKPTYPLVMRIGGRLQLNQAGNPEYGVASNMLDPSDLPSVSTSIFDPTSGQLISKPVNFTASGMFSFSSESNLPLTREQIPKLVQVIDNFLGPYLRENPLAGSDKPLLLFKAD